MLEEMTTIDRIEILASSVILVRRKTAILRDGVEIASQYERWSLAPGTDLAGQDERVVAVANAIWSTEVIEAYQESMQGQLPPSGPQPILGIGIKL